MGCSLPMHSSNSCLENSVDRGAWWAAVHGVAQGRTRLKRLSMHACFGDGNGNPLQYSCLENSVDRGAWWAAVHGVAQSRTRLKWLCGVRHSALHRSPLTLQEEIKAECQPALPATTFFYLIMPGGGGGSAPHQDKRWHFTLPQ